MLVHCSYCEETAYVSTGGLQAVVSDSGDIDGLSVPEDGFPYAFHDVARCVREALTTWQTDIVDDDDGVETLKLTCPIHLQQRNIEELISKSIPRTDDFKSHVLGMEEAASDLIGFLIRVEAHLRTMAQEGDRPYSLELSNTASKLLDQLV